MVHSHSFVAALLLPTLALAAPQGWRHLGAPSSVTNVVVATSAIDAGAVPTPTPVAAEAQPAVTDPLVPEVSSTAVVDPLASSTAVVDPLASSTAVVDPLASSTAVVDPLASSAAAPVASSAAAPAASSSSVPSDGGGSGSGAVSFKNACSDAVTIAKVFDQACGGEVLRQELAAGESWTDTVSNSMCDAGNVALKVYKIGEEVPMHYEYGYKGGMTYYNLSFVNCVNGEDFSSCAGTNWSIAGSGGTGDCQAYQCSGYDDCCKLMGYCDPTATAAGGVQPVGGCVGDPAALDVTMQIC